MILHSLVVMCCRHEVTKGNGVCSISLTRGSISSHLDFKCGITAPIFSLNRSSHKCLEHSLRSRCIRENVYSST